MSKNFFITATNTDIGKTYTTLILLEEFSKRGYRVGVYKPIESGVDILPLDGMKLLKKAQELNPDFKAHIDEVVPYQFTLPAAPYVAKENNIIDKRVLYTNMKKLQSMCDILFIEGAGGLMVPIELDFFMVDLILLFDAYPILVSPSKLGSINDTLLSSNLLSNKKLDHTILINLYLDKDKFNQITKSYYDDAHIKYYILQSNTNILIDKLLNNQI